jgi:uncharacterized cupredoxin-like copper-binding protein
MTRKLQLSVLAGATAFALVLAHAVAPGLAQAHSAHEGHEGHAAHDANVFAAGEPGTADATTRTVEIRITDADGKLAFLPDDIEVKQGDQIKFLLSNNGSVDHEFLIDTVANNAVHKEAMAADPEMQHAEANGRRLKPGEKVELVWRFTKPGSFEMACLIPGHYESGMKGRILVK